MAETDRVDRGPLRSNKPSPWSLAAGWLGIALHAPAWVTLAVLETIGRFRGHSSIESLPVDASAGPERFGFRLEKAPYAWTYRAADSGVPATLRGHRDAVRALAATLMNMYASGADAPTLIGTVGQRLPASSRGFRATLTDLAPEWFASDGADLRLVTGSGPVRFFLSDGPTLQGSPEAFLALAKRLLFATKTLEASGQLSLSELPTGEKQTREQFQLHIAWTPDAARTKSGDGEPTNPEVRTSGSA